MPQTISNLPRERTREINLLIDKFDKGVNKLVEEVRLKNNEAVEVVNLMLVEDGVWKTRWGSENYTPAIAGVTDIDGFGEYIKSDGTKELIIAADDGKIYKSVDGATPSEISGGTLTGGNMVSMLQINDFLYIVNGVDSMLRYNGSTLASFTERSAPAWGGTPLARGAGLSAGDYTYYYQVTTINEVGETTPNAEQSITVDAERTAWVAADDDYITLSWSAATGATGYQIYIGTESGYLKLLKTVQPGVTSWNDDGTSVANTYIETPDDNTTGGPMFSQMCMSNNRLWGTKDPDNEYRVHFTGTGSEIGNFSDYYGGGWIDLEKGGREKPIQVVHYQDGTGSGKLTAICNTPEGTGSIWQITISSITVEEESFSVPSAFKIVGSVGTNAPNSVVLAENDVWFGNKRGAFTLGPEKNYYGILRTNELSSRVRPYWRGIVGSQVENICSYYYDSKVFFSLTTTGTTNNRTIYYDKERLCWVVDWTIGAKQFGEYTDSNGNTHFLYSEPGSSRLVELSDSFAGDKGSSFSTKYKSPRFLLGDDWTDFGKIRKAFIRLGDPVGTLTFEVLGTQKNKGYSAVTSKEITSLFSLTGMGWDQMGSVQMGSSDGTPTAYAQASDIRFVKVNKRLRDIQFIVSSESLESNYKLLGIKAEGFGLEIAPPSSWKVS